jgi:hypothetical protein
MALTESIVRRQIGAIHAYVLSTCSFKYRTTTFSPVEEIDNINAARMGAEISQRHGLLGLYSFGQKYINVLAIYADGSVKEHVAAGFPQYITLFVAELFQTCLENLNVETVEHKIE